MDEHKHRREHPPKDSEQQFDEDPAVAEFRAQIPPGESVPFGGSDAPAVTYFVEMYPPPEEPECLPAERETSRESVHTGRFFGILQILLRKLKISRGPEHVSVLPPADDEASLAGEPQVAQTRSTTTRTPLEEANLRVREILKRRAPEIPTIRALAEEIGCSTGTISKTAAWKVVQKEKRKGRKPKQVRLSDPMLAVTGKDDPELQLLIEAQKRDAAEDNRQAQVYRSQNRTSNFHD